MPSVTDDMYQTPSRNLLYYVGNALSQCTYYFSVLCPDYSAVQDCYTTTLA